MPLTAHQRTLISGRYIGQSTDFRALPSALRWEGVVRAALQELARMAPAQVGKKQAFRQPGGRLVAATGPATLSGHSLDDFALQRISNQAYESPFLQGIAAAGNLTDPKLVGAALHRYHTAAMTHTTNDAFDSAVLGSLLVDIYSLTGAFMKRVLRSAQRTECDCQLFAAYRGVHFAAADELARVFELPADNIDLFLQRQMIGLGGHGEWLDHKQQEKGHLRYLSDAEALACRVQIRDGELCVPNPATNGLSPLDTTGKEWTLKDGNTCHTDKEWNNMRGVSGFAMTLNRNLYAHRHSLLQQEGGAFYHSSYTGGSDVICTGCLTAVKGVLMYVNNFSGHYLPSPSQLQLVLDHFRVSGVNLEGVKVEVQLANGTKVRALAPAFLKNKDYRKTQFDFSDRMAISAKAKHITDAVDAYLTRAAKWYASPSAKSLAVARFLKTIEKEGNLVDEARFHVGELAKSPMHTRENERLDNGELKKRLVEALAKT